MAHGYLRCDRDQLFLMPTSMREWLPEGHLAWFVLDVVSKVNTSAFDDKHPNGGAGRPAYDPRMMLALLMYAYCNNVRSSRRIEQLCESDVAYRIICANHRPDHATIARFRAEHEKAIEGVFVDVLVLCAAAGLTSLGTVAIDGTKMGTDAALRANRSAAAIRAEVERILAEASSTDATEDARHGTSRGNELPAELANPVSRLQRLERALSELAILEAQAEAEAAELTANEQQAAAEGRRMPGPKPGEPQRAAARAEADLAALGTKALDRAAERAAKAQAAAARGRRLGGRRPTDPHEALARAEADLAALQAKIEAAFGAYATKTAEAAAQGCRLRGGRPKARTNALIRAEATLAAAQEAVKSLSDPSADAPSPASVERAEAQQRLVGAQQAIAAAPPPERQINVTDSESRVMKTPEGYLQGYNAQAAVNEEQVVVACGLTQCANDSQQLVPMMATIATMAAAAGIAGGVGCLLADAGYWSEANAMAEGPPRLIATLKDWKQRRAARDLGQTVGPPGEGTTPMEAMEHRLRTAEGAAAYARRSCMIEPVFGGHKENRGFRRFMRRGFGAASSEWSFINTTHNVMKLFRHHGSTGA